MEQIKFIIQQGPHHGAQNSTKMGDSDSITSDCQFASVIAGTTINRYKNYSSSN